MSRRTPSLPARLSREVVDRCVDELVAATDAVFAALEQMARPLAAAWTGGPRPLTTAHLTSLQTHVVDSMMAHSTFNGAGYVLAEPALADRPRYLEWWSRTPEGFEPLVLNLDPEAPDYYDYYGKDWFAAGLLHQQRCAAGPLIDLPCSNVCILTCSTPVVVDGVFVGIAGADVALAKLEPSLLPPMRRLGAPAVLINAERRVILSNDARWTTGERVAAFDGDDEASWQDIVEVTADLGWRLAIAVA
ncbi:MAG: cache domain-containing protein [Acidimicrobiales bacterium]